MRTGLRPTGCVHRSRLAPVEDEPPFGEVAAPLDHRQIHAGTPRGIRRRSARQLRVRDQLEQGPIGVAEVDARAGALGAGARDRPEFDLDAHAFEVRHRVFDRRRPDEAQICTARCDRRPRVRFAVDTRTVDVQLVYPEALRVPVADAHQLGVENRRVELVRPFPITNGDDAVIQRRHTRLNAVGPACISPCSSTAASWTRVKPVRSGVRRSRAPVGSSSWRRRSTCSSLLGLT